MNTAIERAAVSARPEDIATKLRNAPTWVRQRVTGGAAAGNPARPAAKSPAPPAAARWVGWIAGTCCPGVSRPAYQHRDGETLPEQFTPRAWEAMLAQVRSGKSVPVTWDHHGPVIATTDNFDVLFRMEALVGPQFEVRLRDTDLGRKVLAEIDGRSLGVSIGFDKTDSWIVERDGVGRMRVVDGCTLHHVAILPRSATLRPAYSGARCYGLRGVGTCCPSELYRDAHAWAFRILRQQAGCGA
jgi:hypothetical protein